MTDLTFSSSVNGKHIPYGSAGDCYSSAECPQGRFNINLSGTGLVVTQNTTWLSQGTQASQRIERLQVCCFRCRQIGVLMPRNGVFHARQTGVFMPDKQEFLFLTNKGSNARQTRVF